MINTLLKSRTSVVPVTKIGPIPVFFIFIMVKKHVQMHFHFVGDPACLPDNCFIRFN